MLIYVLIGGIYIAWFVNAKQIDSNYCDQSVNSAAVYKNCVAVDGKIYDNFVLTGPWSDNDQALELMYDLNGWSRSELSKGSRFSVVYGLCGFTLLLISIAYLLLAVGARKYDARVTGLVCLCCLECVNFAALITTACFRFNTMGKLAAISLCPSKFEGTNDVGMPTVSDDRTIGTDADLILGLWIAQLIVFLVSCWSYDRLNKPPSPEQLAESTAAASH